MNITTKQFQILSDINLVWDFLVETYDWKNDSGRPAPFFEYALTATWMDSSYSFLDRFWFDGDKEFHITNLIIRSETSIT